MDSHHLPTIETPHRIIVIIMRHIGDVLLTTPLIRSLRSAYPDAQLDVLVYQNTAGILQGNPDISNIITTPQKPTIVEYLGLVRHLFRHYDLAISTQIGDRPSSYAVLAAPFRIAAVPAHKETGWWKRFCFQRWTEFDDVDTHTVLQHLKLADLINVPRIYSVIPPQSKNTRPAFSLPNTDTDYAILHMHPLRVYKRWPVQGWCDIGHFLKDSGLNLVLTGSPDPEEQDYINEIQKSLPRGCINLTGKTSLAQLTDIIAKAKLFVGPDTGITHLAAATGIPVIAIYGPTNPVKWSPWPFNYHQKKNPFAKIGSQHVNNIYLVQGEAECVPCYQEGCDRHRQSHSQCLDTLPSNRIKQVIKKILLSKRP